MRESGGAGPAGLALAAAVLLGAVQGCSPFLVETEDGYGGGNVVVSYVKWRFDDLFETIDLGFSVTAEPQGAFYGHFASLTPFGAGNLDGDFIGIGGGRVGRTRHYIAGMGMLLWGYEEVGWNDYDKDDLTTIATVGVGPLGLLAPPYGRPASAPS